MNIELRSFRDNVPVSEEVITTNSLNGIEGIRQQIRQEFLEGFADNWVATPVGKDYEYKIEFNGGRFVPTKVERKLNKFTKLCDL